MHCCVICLTGNLVSASDIIVTGNASVGAITSGGSCIVGGTLQATGSLPNAVPIVLAGACVGSVPTVNFCGAYLVAGSAASNSIIEFTYVGAVQPHIHMSSSSSFDTCRLKQNNTNRIVLTTHVCNINSTLTVMGNVTAAGTVNGSNLPGPIQPLLSSVSDDPTHGFHSVLASGSALNKLKAINGSAGCAVSSLFDTVNFQVGPLLFPDTTGWRLGLEDISSHIGFTVSPASAWDPNLPLQTDGPGANNTESGPNMAPSSELVCVIPSGAQPCFVASLGVYERRPHRHMWRTVKWYAHVSTTDFDVPTIHNGWAWPVVGSVGAVSRKSPVNIQQYRSTMQKGLTTLQKDWYVSHTYASHNIYGDPASLCDESLATERTLVMGPQSVGHVQSYPSAHIQQSRPGWQTVFGIDGPRHGNEFGRGAPY